MSLKFGVSAPGKFILFGEHSVVYGKPALATAINKRTSLVFATTNTDRVELKFADLKLSASIPLILVQEMFSKCKDLTPDRFSQNFDENVHRTLINISEASFERLHDRDTYDVSQRLSVLCVFYMLFRLYSETKISVGSFVVDVSSDLSIGSGTGSSASYCVCLAAALYQYYRVLCGGDAKKVCESLRIEDRNVINNYAFACEQIIHGKASGLDNFVCTFGSVVEAATESDNKKVFRVLENVFPLRVLLINTKLGRSTAKMVKIASDIRSRNPEIMNQVLVTMAEVCEKASSILIELNKYKTTDKQFQLFFEKLEDLVSLNHGLLVGLQVSNDELDTIANITRKYGLHSKLTGAGGGGYAFTFVPPYILEESVQNCKEALERKDFIVEEVKIGEEGVNII